MSQVVVEGLKWVKHPTADLWRADNLLGRYQVYAVINIVSWAFDAHDGLTRSSGDAASVDEAKAAAQKDYEARIRSTLADPIPEAPADEEVEGVAKLEADSLDAIMEVVGEGAEFAAYNRGKSAMRDWFLAALRRSTATDKPGVREAALEEAAKVAETITQDGDYDLEPEATVAASVAGKQIAAAIRALRTSPPASPTEAGEAGK